MTPLMIAQFMAAAAFFTVGLLHFFIWVRQPGTRVHLLFALTTIASGAVAIAEANFYQATTIEAFNAAFKWTNSLNVLMLVALVWFVVAYTGGWIERRWLPVILSSIFLFAGVANLFLPYGFLYTEITGLRTFSFAGSRVALAVGIDSSWRILTDLAFLGVIALIIDGTLRLRRKGHRRRSVLLGGALLIHMLLVLFHGYLVDTGRLQTPYLFTYGFLVVVLVMSLDLSGEVVRASLLSEEVRANEQRWRSLLENVRLLVAGLDRDGQINYANPFLEEITGFGTADVVGKPFTVLLPAEIREEREQIFKEAMEGDVRLENESRLLTKDGNERKVVWSNVLLQNPNGETTGLLGIGADITEQRHAEAARDQALAEAEDALQEIEKLKNRLEDEVVYLRDEILHIGHFAEIVGQSDALKYVLHRVEQVAPQDTTVTIEGKTGVGKELFARAIHRLSARKKRPLVKVNCAALPSSLIEAELFGHERGAFTGATRTRRGRFELADGSTLFLDEVGELPLELQSKLLRVLQEGDLERVGGDKTIHVDVRVIAATNRKLKEEVAQGRFREDLFYRLHVYPITVPTLRQRKEDIPLLARAFVDRFAQNQGKRIDQIPQPVMDELTGYDWPGNVRELENVIEQAVITTPDNKLKLAARLTPGKNSIDGEDIYRGSLDEVERVYVQQILELAGWRIEGDGGAAELLKLHPNTLRFRMRKLGIHRPKKEASTRSSAKAATT